MLVGGTRRVLKANPGGTDRLMRVRVPPCLASGTAGEKKTREADLPGRLRDTRQCGAYRPNDPCQRLVARAPLPGELTPIARTYEEGSSPSSGGGPG